LRKDPDRGRAHGARPATNRAPSPVLAHALVFAAMGDETRLRLIARLARGRPESIAHLTRGSRLTRQAITKHLRVLERAGLVRCVRAGRESHFELDPRPLREMEEYLSFVSREWDRALERLKAFVEK
jgi:DNA-binding transcriptional ArsR family regulator